jgi:hypothetical protein
VSGSTLPYGVSYSKIKCIYIVGIERKIIEILGGVERNATKFII